MDDDDRRQSVDGGADATVRLLVKNYQSIQSADLQIQGFTAVTGKSNLGKSALIRAATGAMFGQLGEAFIRRLEMQTAVGVWFDDGLVLKWYKVPTDKKSPGRQTQLVINEQKYTRLGREHPTLTAPLGFKTIDLSAGGLRPQVALQFDKPFLVAENDSVVAEAFKVLGRGDVVAKARDAVKKDWGLLAAELKLRAEDLVKAEAEARAYDWVPALKTEFQNAEGRLRAALAEKDKREGILAKVAELRGVALFELPAAVIVTEPLPGVLDTIIVLKSMGEEEELPNQLRELTPRDELIGTLERIVEVQRSRDGEASLEMAVPRRREEATTAEAEIAKMEKELGYCPTCKKPFEAVHVH